MFIYRVSLEEHSRDLCTVKEQRAYRWTLDRYRDDAVRLSAQRSVHFPSLRAARGREPKERDGAAAERLSAPALLADFQCAGHETFTVQTPSSRPFRNHYMYINLSQ